MTRPHDTPPASPVPSVPPAPTEPEAPLPVWFFVGLILFVYGILVLAAGVAGDPRPTVLAELRPALWWGGVMIAGGIVFLGIGLRGRPLRKRSNP